MAFMLSPGVQITEKDFTNVVPAVAVSNGAYAGVFRWGPVMDPVTVTSENELVQLYGAPTLDADLATSFFSAANFLAYSNNLLLVRLDTGGQRNAVITPSGAVLDIDITSAGSGYTVTPTITIAEPDLEGGIQAEATATIADGGIATVTITNPGFGYTSGPAVTVTPGIDDQNVADITVDSGGASYASATVTISDPDDPDYGNTATATATIVAGVITDIVVTYAGSGYTSAPTVTIEGVAIEGETITPASATAVLYATGNITAPTLDATITDPYEGVKINNEDAYETNFAAGGSCAGEFAAKYPGTLGNSIRISMADAATYDDWEYKEQFDGAPTANELHIIVWDDNGAISGTAGGILEKFAFLNKASNGRRSDGTNTYYGFVINETSKYIWWLNHPGTATPSLGQTRYSWGEELVPGTLAFDMIEPYDEQLSGGVDDYAATDGEKMNGYALFTNAELYDISLIVTGKASSTVSNWIIGNVAEVRKDCVAFVSPINVSSGQPIIGTGTAKAQDIVAYRNALNLSSSYGVMDSGYKYQYDRYNDVFRWIPLNADVAGLCARTDLTDDPWWSPGGYTRGQIKNVVKLSFNPDQTSRDILYKNGVNPVVSFPGQGTILYGDKTLLAKPSAFDRINVRRLFIVLEKAIATAAKYQLFEFNDQFTRAMFKNMVEPFLREVKGRRGLYDFLVKCDETNNTPEVIDTNRFVADIYIKPARSINFITLNFIAVRTGVNFEELGA